MPGRRQQHVWHHVRPKQVLGVVGPVEQKVKGMFRMRHHQPLHYLVREAPDALQLVAGQQETDVNGDVHVSGGKWQI